MKKLLATTLVVCLALLSACKPNEVKLANKISKSTVMVHIMISKGDEHAGALCAGVVVAPHEVLLADHCVDFDREGDGITVDKIWVKDYEGRAQVATVEAKDHSVDLAVLNIRKAEVPAEVAYSQPPVGSTVWVVGMPLGIRWNVTKGIVSRTDETIFGFLGSFFVTDATVLPGNSGGGVWNENGQLVGIVSMSTSMMGTLGASGLGIIVDTNTIRNFLYN